LDVYAELQLNTTAVTKTETLNLPVLQVGFDDHATALDAANGQLIPAALLAAFNDKHLLVKDTALVSVVTAGSKWRITSGANEYTLEKTVNSAGVQKIDVLYNKQYVLDPYLFSIEAAGKLLLGIPNNDGTALATEFARLSGAFSIEISSEGLQIFAVAELQLRRLDALFDDDRLLDENRTLYRWQYGQPRQFAEP
jgi:hypothetical protein